MRNVGKEDMQGGEINMYEKLLRNIENFKNLQEGFKQVEEKRKKKGEEINASRNSLRS